MRNSSANIKEVTSIDFYDLVLHNFSLLLILVNFLLIVLFFVLLRDSRNLQQFCKVHVPVFLQ